MELSQNIIFNFTHTTSLTSWSVVDDGVMGGKSEGNFKINENGHGEFSGKVSLANNGGFSSLRHRFKQTDVSKHTKIILKIKGDGTTYQFRVKDNQNHQYSYIHYFTTNTNWQLVEINLADMYPSFRGRKLDMKNFSFPNIEEIGILIGNSKQQNFKLEIDKIYLQ